MKKIFTLLASAAILFPASFIKAEDAKELFREEFSFITEVWYGEAGKDVVWDITDFNEYCDHQGWDGFNITIGAPTDPDGASRIPTNETAAPRIGSWTGDNHITTPTIDCSAYGTVTVSCLLKRVSRSNANKTMDDPNIKFLHAADGENFELVENVITNIGSDDPTVAEMTEHKFTVIGATATSKFRWQVSLTDKPNRFFIDDVVVVGGGGNSLFENKENACQIAYKGGLIEIASNQPLAAVKIINLAGQTVYTGQESLIDITKLNTGVYVISVALSDGQIVVNKIVKE